MPTDQDPDARAALPTRLWRHFKRQFVAYVAVIIALSMSPLPSYAASKFGTNRLKNNAVTSAKIKDGAVTSADLAAGAVQNANLGDGSVTASKLGTIIVRSTSVVVSNGTGDFAQISCQPGEKRLSGGAQTAGVGTAAGWNLIRSGPSGPNGWDAAVRNSTGSSGTLIVEILCLS